MLASKPVGRFQYLIGKWIGLGLLNIVLCAIVGVGVWLGARVLANEPPPKLITQEAIRNKIITETDVLAARVTAYPVPGKETDLQALVDAEYEELKRQFPGTLPAKLSDVDRAMLVELRGKAIARWHTVGSQQMRTYVFEGFKPLADEFTAWARQRQEMNARYEQFTKEKREEEAEALAREIDALAAPITSLRLRIKPKASPSPRDGMVRLALRIGGQVPPIAPIPDDTVYEQRIPLTLIEPDGRIIVNIANPSPPNGGYVIKFETYEGIEMLYTEGTFEGNIFRAMLVHWFRLGFLAMLSLAMGTILGFPMACFSSIVIYGIAVFSSFAAESVDAYASFSVRDKSKWEIFIAIIKGIWDGIISGEIWSIGRLIITLVGNVVLIVVPSFAYYNSTPLLSDGRMVSMDLVGETSFNVGLLATGACLLIGWLLFRKKELARVTV